MVAVRSAEQWVRDSLPVAALASEGGYQYAYGYLASAVRSFLNGGRDTRWLRAVVTELDAVLDGVTSEAGEA